MIDTRNHLRIAVVDAHQAELNAHRANHMETVREWKEWATGVFFFIIGLLAAFAVLSIFCCQQQAVITGQATQVHRLAVQNDKQSTAIRFYQRSERFAAASALASRD